jgi:arabinofuranosyltransferase
VASAWRDDALVIVAAAVPLTLYLLRERTIAGAAGFPLDDSWIHLHFARNIAEGAGFSYNAGTPVAGSTAPLWTLLLAAVAVVGGGATVWLAKAVGVTCMLATALLTRRLVSTLGAPREAAFVAALGLVAAGPMAWGALAGMEVPLAAALVAGALLAHAHDRPLGTALLSALAILARPETAILLPLLLVARPLTVRRVAIFVILTGILLAPTVWFSLVTTGTPLPATASAKIEGGLVGWLGGLREPVAQAVLHRPWQFLREWVGWLWLVHWLLPIAIVPILALAWRRGGRLWLGPASALVLHPLAMALLAPYRGPGFQEGRYSTHLLPVALALLWGFTRRRHRMLAVAYLAVALGLLGPAATRYAWGVQNINAMQVHLGHWIAAHTSAGARLALNDIGAIAFISRRPIIDLMGLVTPAIHPYRRQGEAGVIRYVQETCPDYLVIFPAWFPTLADLPTHFRPIYRVRLERNEVAGADEMAVYEKVGCSA